VMDEFSGWHIP